MQLPYKSEETPPENKCKGRLGRFASYNVLGFCVDNMRFDSDLSTDVIANETRQLELYEKR
jgi:hypothetical protein